MREEHRILWKSTDICEARICSSFWYECSLFSSHWKGHVLTRSSAPTILYAPFTSSALAIETVDSNDNKPIDSSIGNLIKNQLKSVKNISSILVLDPILNDDEDYTPTKNYANISPGPFKIDGFYPV